MPPIQATAIQMNSGDRASDNLRRAATLLSTAAAAGTQLAVLPEFFPLLASDEKAKLTIAERDQDGPIQNFLAETATRHQMYIVGGTIPITAPPHPQNGTPRVYAACLLYGPDGTRLARYDKLHLFRYHGKTQSHDESQTIARGASPTTVDTPIGRITLAVCYDLRFPEHFRHGEAPDIIAIPSAFTVPTGRAHWKILLAARAIENLCHIIGAAQAGTHPGGRKTYGHSAIIGPWGDTLARATTNKDELVTATINPEERTHRRQELPALTHRLLP